MAQTQNSCCWPRHNVDLTILCDKTKLSSPWTRSRSSNGLGDVGIYWYCNLNLRNLHCTPAYISKVIQRYYAPTLCLC